MSDHYYQKYLKYRSRYLEAHHTDTSLGGQSIEAKSPTEAQVGWTLCLPPTPE